MTNRILIIVIAIFAVLLILSISLTVLITTTPVFSSNHATAESASSNETGANASLAEEPLPTVEQNSEDNTSVGPDEESSPTSPEQSAMETDVLSSTPTPGSPTLEQPAMPSEPTPQPSSPSNTVTNSICDIPGAYTTTFILEDSYTFEPPFGAELIRVIRVDSPMTVVVSLSSYLAVPATSLKQEYGILESTLGSVYHTVYQRTSNPARRHAEAARTVNAVISEGFDIATDYYISVDQKFLRQLIKFTGPVVASNPAAFRVNETDFPTGSLELNASNIWQFVTYSSGPDDEINRLARQDNALQALFAAIQTEKTLNELSVWLLDHEDQIRTDLDADQLLTTFCTLSFSADGSLEFRQIPADNMAVEGSRLHLVDPSLLSGLFQ